MTGEDCEKVLARVVEYYLVVLPRMNRTSFHSDIERGYFFFPHCGPRMQLEVVVHCNRLFSGFWNERDAYIDIEFPPAS